MKIDIPMAAPVEDQILHSNSYAVSYRLLGDADRATAVSTVAIQRVHQLSEENSEDWLQQLVLFTVAQSLHPTAIRRLDEPGSPSTTESGEHADPDASLREALRRRLDSATPEEQIAGCLIQLCGYPSEFVAGCMGVSSEAVRVLAAVIAPPPGVSYRNLGDPSLTGAARPATARKNPWRPHWTTVVAILLVMLAVLYATQVTGPRPTLTNEGGFGATPALASEAPQFQQRSTEFLQRSTD